MNYVVMSSVHVCQSICDVVVQYLWRALVCIGVHILHIFVIGESGDVDELMMFWGDKVNRSQQVLAGIA